MYHTNLEYSVVYFLLTKLGNFGRTDKQRNELQRTVTSL